MTPSLASIARAVALTKLPGIADGRAQTLIEDFGSPEVVFAASASELPLYRRRDV